MTEDERLVRGIVRKRRGVLERVIDMYTPYVGTVIYNVCGDGLSKEDIEEIAADTFVTLWRTAQSFDANRGTLRAYLAAIARNLTLDRLRRRKIAEPLDENLAENNADPCEIAEKNSERAELIRAVNTLGEPDSEIFIRYYWYNESISRISKRTGISGGTIKSKLARGRRKLKAVLEGEERL